MELRRNEKSPLEYLCVLCAFAVIFEGTYAVGPRLDEFHGTKLKSPTIAHRVRHVYMLTVFARFRRKMSIFLNFLSEGQNLSVIEG
ncbi:MAG: hypothetical protein D6723_11850 [Acidobacteria bacterium]|nr:MAG: hypothetical protein D6723_11850 [Acidobacteriota bacterium]